MATSSTVANGDLATAAQYNDARTDILVTHDHDGTDGNSALQASSVTPTSGNLTLSTAAGADVLIGDDVTLLFVDGGAGNVGIGAATNTGSLFQVGGSYTGGTSPQLVDIAGAITTPTGSSQAHVFNLRGTVTTFAASDVYTVISSLRIVEPTISLGAGSSATAAASLYILNAPTEATNNYALWVDAGATQLDGTLTVGDDVTLSKSGVTITGSAGNINITPAGETVTTKRFNVDAVGTFLEHVASSSSGALGHFENTNTADAAHMQMSLKTDDTGLSNTWLEWVKGTDRTWSMGIDANSATEDDSLVISDASNLGSGDLMRFKASTNVVFLDNDHGTNFDYVCNQCGRSSIDAFLCCGVVAWHDDVLAIRQYQMGDITSLIHLGVVEVDPDWATSPGHRMLNINKAFDLTWASLWQNREYLDNLAEENIQLKGRLQSLESSMLSN